MAVSRNLALAALACWAAATSAASGTPVMPPLRLAPGARYVAMGSSFAAGPGVIRRVAGSPAGCGRSALNYAHQIAERHRLALTDVTCSGATTADILTHRQLNQPPQIDAVDASTKLVTITIGGNDVSYMGNIIAASCLTLHPTSTHCKLVGDEQVERVFADLAQRMTAVIAATRARAPEAEIVLVDYFTVVPEHGSCEKLLPLNAAQLSGARAVAQHLAQITEQVAEANHVRLVKLSEASAHHDVCARDPWIQGYEPVNASPDFKTPPYHPNLEGMTGAAEAIEKALFRG